MIHYLYKQLGHQVIRWRARCAASLPTNLYPICSQNLGQFFLTYL